MNWRWIYLIIGIVFGIAFTIALCIVAAYAQAQPAQAQPAQAQYRLEGGMALPDRDVTPGAVDPAAVADLSGAPHLVAGVERNICARDFRTAPIRAHIKNFAKLKRKACQEYTITKCDASVEGDHLISLEIGGCPDCLTNIWPQTMDEARVKDHQVEDVLPGLVCQGKMTLADAQQCIARDWIACEEQIKKLGIMSFTPVTTGMEKERWREYVQSSL